MTEDLRVQIDFETAKDAVTSGRDDIRDLEDQRTATALVAWLEKEPRNYNRIIQALKNVRKEGMIEGLEFGYGRQGTVSRMVEKHTGIHVSRPRERS